MAVRRDWMVETEWIELVTPHPVIEPVSDQGVTTELFDSRSRGKKISFDERKRDRRGQGDLRHE